jgi:hypothetical protein
MFYDQYFSEFDFVDKTAPFCKVRLKTPAFVGVEVVIAQQFVVVDNHGQQEIKFDYDVTGKPDGVNVETLEFTDLIKNIFMAILEREMEKKPKKPIYVQAESNEGTAPEGSLQAGPETQEQGE